MSTPAESVPISTPWKGWRLAGREAVPLIGREPWIDQILAALTEFIGTMFFVYIGCLSIVSSGGIQQDFSLNPARMIDIALAHGFALAVVIFASAKISGGHINPAVTLALFVTNNIAAVKAFMYIVCQLLGALIGAAFVKASTNERIQGSLGATLLADGTSAGSGFLIEFLATFLLVFVVFSTAVTDQNHNMGKFAPLAIGLTVLVMALAVGPLTGCSMNPARSFGPAVVGSGSNKALWIYFIAPPLGGCCAGLLYKFAYLRRFKQLEELQIGSAGSYERLPPSRSGNVMYTEETPLKL